MSVRKWLCKVFNRSSFFVGLANVGNKDSDRSTRISNLYRWNSDFVKNNAKNWWLIRATLSCYRKRKTTLSTIEISLNFGCIIRVVDAIRYGIDYHLITVNKFKDRLDFNWRHAT